MTCERSRENAFRTIEENKHVETQRSRGKQGFSQKQDQVKQHTNNYDIKIKPEKFFIKKKLFLTRITKVFVFRRPPTSRGLAPCSVVSLGGEQEGPAQKTCHTVVHTWSPLVTLWTSKCVIVTLWKFIVWCHTLELHGVISSQVWHGCQCEIHSVTVLLVRSASSVSGIPAWIPERITTPHTRRVHPSTHYWKVVIYFYGHFISVMRLFWVWEIWVINNSCLIRSLWLGQKVDAKLASLGCFVVRKTTIVKFFVNKTPDKEKKLAWQELQLEKTGINRYICMK